MYFHDDSSDKKRRLIIHEGEKLRDILEKVGVDVIWITGR